MDDNPHTSNPANETPRSAAPDAADALQSPSPSENLQSDITDELSDHLALAARDLQLAGHPADEAHQLAHQKFGDVSTIRRRLWWIHQGDEVMLRAILAVICAVLLIAVTVLGVGNWRMSRTIDDLHGALADLSENQKQITDAQKTILETQRLNRPLTIQGLLYVGEPLKPAAGAEVHLYRVSDRKLIDKYHSDRDGKFVTAPLAPDHYFVVAPLVGENPAASHDEGEYRPTFAVQSESISIARQAVDPQIALDVSMIPLGQVSLELTQKFSPPSERNENGADRRARVFQFRDGVPRQLSLVVAMYNQGNALPRLQIEDATAPVIPLAPGFYTGRPLNVSEYSYRQDSRGMWAAGPFEPGTPYPLRRFFLTNSGNSRPLSETGSFRVAAYFKLSGLTPSTRSNLKRPPEWDRAKSLPAEQFTDIEIKDGKRTHLRLTPPIDFDKEAQEVLDGIGTEQDLVAALDRLWPVKVEFAGFTEMMDKSE